MGNKVMWLFLWITMAFWGGCAAQERELAQDHVPLYREGFAAANEGTVLPAEGDPELDVEPSVVGVGRSNWRPMLAAPARGLVPHHPAYFGQERQGFGIDWRASWEHPTPLDWEGVIEHQADFATAGARSRFNRRVVADVPLRVGKFAFDLVTLPYRVVRTPPWEIRWSPREDEVRVITSKSLGTRRGCGGEV